MKFIRNLRSHLGETLGVQPILQHAYADFEQIETNAQGQLYLMGVETHNVLGTEHKNAADMRLCIDVMEALYTRPEIDAFFFVAGDRDYIPVIQHLRRRAKTVYVIAFKDNASGDLIVNVENGFIDARSLLEKVELSELDVGQQRLSQKYKERRDESNLQAEKRAEKRFEAPPKELRFERTLAIKDQNALIALEVLLHNYADKPEVWFTPFLNKLRNELQHLAEYERKALVSTLESHGAVKVTKIKADPHDYSVLFINNNHPDVQRHHPGYEIA